MRIALLIASFAILAAEGYSLHRANEKLDYLHRQIRVLKDEVNNFDEIDFMYEQPDFQST